MEREKKEIEEKGKETGKRERERERGRGRERGMKKRRVRMKREIEREDDGRGVIFGPPLCLSDPVKCCPSLQRVNTEMMSGALLTYFGERERGRERGRERERGEGLWTVGSEGHTLYTLHSDTAGEERKESQWERVS